MSDVLAKACYGGVVVSVFVHLVYFNYRTLTLVRIDSTFHTNQRNYTIFLGKCPVFEYMKVCAAGILNGLNLEDGQLCTIHGPPKKQTHA